MAGTMRGMADGHDPEAPPEQRVGRIGHLDLFRVAWRVLERGIMLVGPTLQRRNDALLARISLSVPEFGEESGDPCRSSGR
jgi:hypothetical protein